MKKSDIIEAYCLIRKIDNTIPDEVLDFMKNSALNRLNNLDLNCKEDCFSCKHWNEQISGCKDCILDFERSNL